MSPDHALVKRLLEEARQDLCGVEPLLGDGTSCSRVPAIVPFDLADTIYSSFEIRERHDALTDRKHSREAGVLEHDRLASGQVAGRALAEPACLTADVAVLGHAPLGL